jgi:hypothetical protein
MAIRKIIIGLTIAASHWAMAQVKDVDRYRNAAVFIDVGAFHGSGFIIAQSKDSVFVATALHVVEDDPTPPLMTVEQRQHIPARVLFKAPKPYDLAILGARLAGFSWKPVPIITNLRFGEDVYFVSMLEAERPLLPTRYPATYDKRDSNTATLYITTNAVRDGHSGSALLCSEGIVGMILSTEVESLDINKIKELVRAWKPAKWQLIDKEY